MSNPSTKKANGASVQRGVRRLCATHPEVNYKTAWGCPECVREMRLLLTAAAHTLRSYQYGNASPELAESVANRIETALSPNNRICDTGNKE